ncbi:DUF2487 family protein [Paenibacillus macerans]|uniref:DUF2487 family protein n=1 Tax=Paenibacillus macerans TaxID=44252 RepID=UPI002E1A9806|nr:DUF2487 family protein [Paenibacillus macerans]
MKFSEVEASGWEELRPYLDTCLVPVTGLTGLERPYEVTEKLERLKSVMDWVEIPFKGRVVTYPSIQYAGDRLSQAINKVCENVKRSGFAYAIVISADLDWADEELPNADLIITPGRFSGPDPDGGSAAGRVKEKVQHLWTGGSRD